MIPSPQRRLSVEDLGTKYGSERAHSEQVTALALGLFDAAAGLMAVPADDRPLLEAAGRLHEVGYGVNPRRHAWTGCEIVRREGLEGFSDIARDDIAAAIFLHPTRGGATDRSRARRLRISPRARRLAAFLRIGDGLDAAHLQDAAFSAVWKTRRTLCLQVTCHDFSPDLAQADRKADLWRQVFPVELQIARAPGRSARPAPLLTPDLPVIEGARRLLCLGFSSLLANVPGALGATDQEALHDARAGIRRMRVVLRVFRKPLEPTSAARIERDLKRVNTALGDARDLDVWIDLLTGTTLRQQLATHPRGKRFIDHQVELRRLGQATVRRHLGGASFAALQARVGHLLRIELPPLMPTTPAGSLEPFARRALAKLLRQTFEEADLRRARSVAKLHCLRIALRRLRYLSEAFGGLLGPPVETLGKRIHATEWALGRLRDADLALARIRREGPSPPRLLVLWLERRRRKAAAELTKAWQRLTEPGFLDKVRRRLDP